MQMDGVIAWRHTAMLLATEPFDALFAGGKRHKNTIRYAFEVSIKMYG